MAAKPTLLLFIVFAVVLEAALGSPAPTDQEGISKNTEDNPDTETDISIPQLRTAGGSQQQEDAAVEPSESREEENQPGLSTGTGESEQERLGEKEDSVSEGSDNNDSDDDDDDDDSDNAETQDEESVSTQVKNGDTRYVKRDGNDEEDGEQYAQENFKPSPAYLKSERPTITEDGTYVVYDEERNVCILAYIKTRITLYYPDKQDTHSEVVVSPDDDKPKISGTCDRVSQTADLVVAWDAFVFTISFRIDDLKRSWYASQFKIVADLSHSIFKDSKSDGNVTLTSPEEKRYWQTSQDRSFRCQLLHDVSLSDKEGDYKGSIHTDEARVQAFSDGPSFKTPKYCIHRSKRDEMVPITVGAVLASLTLVTITGYAIFRYFKIKKVQYDTME